MSLSKTILVVAKLLFIGLCDLSAAFFGTLLLYLFLGDEGFFITLLGGFFLGVLAWVFAIGVSIIGFPLPTLRYARAISALLGGSLGLFCGVWVLLNGKVVTPLPVAAEISRQAWVQVDLQRMNKSDLILTHDRKVLAVCGSVTVSEVNNKPVLPVVVCLGCQRELESLPTLAAAALQLIPKSDAHWQYYMDHFLTD